MKKLRKKREEVFFQTLSSLRIWVGVWKSLADQSGWVNMNIRNIMMGWSSGLSSRVSCFYNHIIENNSKTVISRLFMDSKIMLYALQEVCRTTLNSFFSSRKVDYFAPERSFGSWNFSAGPGHLEANGIMAVHLGAPWVNEKDRNSAKVLCKVLPFVHVPT